MDSHSATGQRSHSYVRLYSAVLAVPFASMLMELFPHQTDSVWSRDVFFIYSYVVWFLVCSRDSVCYCLAVPQWSRGGLMKRALEDALCLVYRLNDGHQLQQQTRRRQFHLLYPTEFHIRRLISTRHTHELEEFKTHLPFDFSWGVASMACHPP